MNIPININLFPMITTYDEVLRSSSRRDFLTNPSPTGQPWHRPRGGLIWICLLSSEFCCAIQRRLAEQQRQNISCRFHIVELNCLISFGILHNKGWTSVFLDYIEGTSFYICVVSVKLWYKLKKDLCPLYTFHFPLSTVHCLLSTVHCTLSILIASRTSILGFNSTNIRCPSPV